MHDMLYRDVLYILTVILGDENITLLELFLRSARNSNEYCSDTKILPICQPAYPVNASVPSTSSGFLSTSSFSEGEGIR